jgi:hypothetical protein
VVLAEVLDVPRVRHHFPVLGLQADYLWPGDLYYPVRAFPLWRELVYPFCLLNLAQYKISFFELPGADPPAMIAAKPLPVTSGSHSCPAPDLLEKVGIVNLFHAL